MLQPNGAQFPERNPLLVPAAVLHSSSGRDYIPWMGTFIPSMHAHFSFVSWRERKSGRLWLASINFRSSGAGALPTMAASSWWSGRRDCLSWQRFGFGTTARWCRNIRYDSLANSRLQSHSSPKRRKVEITERRFGSGSAPERPFGNRRRPPPRVGERFHEQWGHWRPPVINRAVQDASTALARCSSLSF